MEPRAHRIGVIADTHVPSALRCLPDSLAAALAGVDRIVHAGDLVSLSVLDELNAIAPTTAVVGNCDPPEVARHLPARATVEIAGRRVGIQHGHQSHFLQNQYIAYGYDAPEFDLFYEAMATQLPDAEVIVFGHFHTPIVREWHGILFINPGSVAPPHARPTFVMLEIGERLIARVDLLA
jgi:hypothetical protein